MRRALILAAGGKGTRTGDTMPKQFHLIEGQPLLWLAVRPFLAFDPNMEVVIVLPTDWIDHLASNLPNNMAGKCRFISGGATRADSVRAGLAAVHHSDLVAVHDAARPFVTEELIRLGFATAETTGAAYPVIPIIDSLRVKEEDGLAPVDRDKFVAIQTPQVFSTAILQKAYDEAPKGTYSDCSQLVEAAGFPVQPFPGDAKNMKVTTATDLQYARLMLG